MFLAVMSAGVVIYEKLPSGRCENRRVLGAQAAPCEPHLSSVGRQTAPTLPPLPHETVSERTPPTCGTAGVLV